MWPPIHPFPACHNKLPTLWSFPLLHICLFWSFCLDHSPHFSLCGPLRAPLEICFYYRNWSDNATSNDLYASNLYNMNYHLHAFQHKTSLLFLASWSEFCCVYACSTWNLSWNSLKVETIECSLLFSPSSRAQLQPQPAEYLNLIDINTRHCSAFSSGTTWVSEAWSGLASIKKQVETVRPVFILPYSNLLLL